MDRYVELPNNKPLLSLILLREGAITEEQADQALREWRRRREDNRGCAFGQIILQLRFMNTAALRPFLLLQRALAAPPAERKQLGVLILENGLLRPTQLLHSLKRSKQTRRPLGETLIADGLLRRSQLEILLRFQGRHLQAS